MSWENVDLKGVSTDVALISEGPHVFELLPGAKSNEAGALLCQAAVVDEGEFKGKRVLFNYPDPESINSKGNVNSWSAVALKRLEVASGVDIDAGESKVDYLNRIAGTRFASAIKYNEDSTGQKRMNLQILNVKAAA